MTKNKVLKIIIICLLLSLVLIISGISKSFVILRWDILVVSLVLAVECFYSRRYYWGIIFIIFAIFFNPWARLSLSKTEWIIADLFVFISLIIWSLEYFRSYHKGLSFEKFIRNKFPGQKYVIEDATKDLHKKIHRFVESDKNPDLVFREKTTGKTFAVECKYRSSYKVGNLGDEGIWWKKDQGNRYLYYSQQKNIPVYVAIGIGGNPRSPKTVALIPIEIIQNNYYKFITREIIEKYPLSLVV